MALLKFGSVITEGSGKLGGHVIQHSKGGMQLRNKPRPRTGCSSDQYAIRSVNPVLQAGWQALTDSQRKIWNDWPVIHGIMNAQGDHMPLSGHSLWMKLQFQPIFNGEDFWPTPAGPAGPLYGPELIMNGTFDNSDYWYSLLKMNISGGKANYTGGGTGRMITDLVTISDCWYKLEFDISNASPTAQLEFYAFNIGHLFKPPYSWYELVSNGHYNWTVQADVNSPNFQPTFREQPSTCSIDNLSYKQIL
jgi:hypothetical protein